jgi:hypothetical protein
MPALIGRRNPIVIKNRQLYLLGLALEN